MCAVPREILSAKLCAFREEGQRSADLLNNVLGARMAAAASAGSPMLA